MAGEGVEFADLFAEDGVLAYPFGLPGQPAELRGRDAIRAYFADRGRARDLLVMDGHTAVIGGIYTRNTGRNLDQIPFFGDIPILGVLFQRRRAADARGELLIFITPRILNRQTVAQNL